MADPCVEQGAFQDAVGLRNGPVWDGLALVLALIGVFVVGLIVELTTRYMTGGTYSSRPMSF